MTLIFSVTAEESITHCIVLLPKRIPYIMKRMVCGTKLKTIDIRTLMLFSYVNISLFLKLLQDINSAKQISKKHIIKQYQKEEITALNMF